MNKICTSLEQSKKLIELGIDIFTADMYYDGYDRLPQGYAYTLIFPNSFEYDIPAWSLSALSNFILPYVMDDDGNNYKINISKDGLDRWVAYYKSGDLSIHICEESKDLIDVIFEMVCWLKENKRI